MKVLNKQNMKKQSGFTLIELVIVIVILGILAATAAPKFIDLQGDAKGAVLKGVKGAIDTAISGVHAKSLIAGNNKVVKASGETVKVGNDDIEIGSGWPLATKINFIDIKTTTPTTTGILDISEDDFDILVVGTEIFFTPTQTTPLATKTAIEAAECYVGYEESTDSNVKPEITVDVDKC